MSEEMKRRPARTRERGFTLIELGIVIAVTSILAAVIVPDFIEMARNRAGKESARQVEELEEAAKSFYHEMAVAAGNDPMAAAWPGESPPHSCDGGNSLSALLSWSSMDPSKGKNPWKKDLTMALVRDPGGGVLADVNCRLQVTTMVPLVVTGVVDTYLPGARCGASCPGEADAGFAICCHSIQKPGIEVAIMSTLVGHFAGGAP